MKSSEFPGELILHRSKHGLTQKELADRLDVSTRSVNAWEAGKSKPQKAMRIRLAHEFGLKSNYFLDMDELPGGGVEENGYNGELESLRNTLADALARANVSDELKENMSRFLDDATEKLMRSR